MSTPRRPLLWTLSLATIVAGAIATGCDFTSSPPATHEQRRDVSVPATTALTSIAIAPDGLTLAFAAVSDGREALWVQSLDRPSPRVLTGTAGASFPFWSPDSHTIGFFADAQLKRIDIESGAVQVLASAEIPLGGTWSRDDTILFTPGLADPVMRISAKGGSSSAVTEVNGKSPSQRFPQALPDGRHFLYYATGSAPGIYVGDLGGDNPRPLLEAQAAVFAAPDQLLFVRQGTLYAQPLDAERVELSGQPTALEPQVMSQAGSGVAALSASASGDIVYRAGRLEEERELIWFDRTGHEVERVPGSRGSAGISVAFSPDRRTVAFDRLAGGTTDVWLLDLARGVPSRFTSDPLFEIYPVWSQDGTRIAFQSNRKSPTGTTFDIYVKAVSGDGKEALLLADESSQIPTDWSPDGRFVIYTDTRKGIWAVTTNGDPKPFPVVQTTSVANGAQFSPDGKWIAYQSQESGSRMEIFVQRFPGPGDRSRISTDGGVQVRWRGDGHELFFLDPNNRMLAVPVRLDPAHDRVEVGKPASLFGARLIGNPQGASSRQYMVSADGQRFLLDSPADVTRPITVIVNWKPKAL